MSGSRHFHSASIDVLSDDSESGSDSDSSSSDRSAKAGPTSSLAKSRTLGRQPLHPYSTDTSAKLWRLDSFSSISSLASEIPIDIPELNPPIHRPSAIELGQDQSCLAPDVVFMPKVA